MSSPSGYPPIESLAFLSDGVVTALVAPDGSVEWLCLPRMDGPSTFAAILDREAGHFRVGPAGGGAATAQRYLPGSLVLETTWETSSGTLVVTDALAVDELGRPDRCLVRLARCTAGEVELDVQCIPAPDFGRRAHDWSMGPLYLGGDIHLVTEGSSRSGQARLSAGDGCALVLGWGDPCRPPGCGRADRHHRWATGEAGWRVAGSRPARTVRSWSVRP